MMTYIGKSAPVFILFLTLFLIDGGVNADYADARSKMGGRMFSRPAPKKAPVQQNMQQTNKTTQQKGGLSKGLMGGLMGGALAGLLFGSLFGAPGTGMGLLPILLLAGAGFFLYRRFAAKAGAGAGGGNNSHSNIYNMQGDQVFQQPSPTTQFSSLSPAEQGLQEIRQTDPGFDDKYFIEVTSDVFFKIQAGWMRRDLESYGHLLGEQLALEYAEHFAEMQRNGHINKLESIAIRRIEIVSAGSDGREDFVTVLFAANLLDYTVDENSGELISGSDTTPVKFEEEWTWARPSRTENWLLEGINVVSG